MSIFTDEELLMLVGATEGLTPAKQRKALAWLEQARFNAGLLEAALEGQVRIVDVKQGEPLFQLTAAGVAHVETELLPQARQQD